MVALGLLALVAGVGLLVAEAHLPTAGVLGGAGVLSLAAACWLLVAEAGGGLAVALPATLIVLAVGLSAIVLTGRHVRKAGRRALHSGVARLPGSLATVRAWEGDAGQVSADGALWRARLSWPDEAAPTAGVRVVVEGLDGLTLLVRVAEPWELQ